MNYKNHIWESEAELAMQLDSSSYAIHAWLKRHPDKTIYDYIDMREAEKIERVRDTRGVYRDLEWINFEDLGKQLGVSRQFLCKISKQDKLTEYLDRRLELTGQI